MGGRPGLFLTIIVPSHFSVSSDAFTRNEYERPDLFPMFCSKHMFTTAYDQIRIQ